MTIHLYVIHHILANSLPGHSAQVMKPVTECK